MFLWQNLVSWPLNSFKYIMDMQYIEIINLCVQERMRTGLKSTKLTWTEKKRLGAFVNLFKLFLVRFLQKESLAFWVSPFYPCNAKMNLINASQPWMYCSRAFLMGFYLLFVFQSTTSIWLISSALGILLKEQPLIKKNYIIWLFSFAS